MMAEDSNAAFQFSRKTKSGCVTCKQKKVRCDEHRPVCLRCQRNHRSCSYAQTSSHGNGVRSFSPAADNWGWGALSKTRLSNIYSLPDAKNGTTSTYLIRHFQDHWTEIFQMPRSYEIIMLSKSDPLIRSTILAMSACHLRHVSPGHLQHRIAEHFQQSQALQEYQNAIDTPFPQLGQSGVDALLLSGALLMMLAFTIPHSDTSNDTATETNLSTSWVFSNRENRLDWLALQVGIEPLMLSMAVYVDKSMDFLAHVFFGDSEETWAFNRLKPVPNRVPALWTKFFELDGVRHDTNNFAGLVDRAHERRFRAEKRITYADVFTLPTKILAELRLVEPGQLNVFKNLQFFGKITVDFRTLLYERDEKALWLFGYWLGIMCRFEGVWWCDARVRRDYRAILMWLERLNLEQRPGDEGDMWREMMEELRNVSVYVRN